MKGNISNKSQVVT